MVNRQYQRFYTGQLEVSPRNLTTEPTKTASELEGGAGHLMPSGSLGDDIRRSVETACDTWYPLVNVYIAMERSTMLLMGKSTISTGPFSIAMLVHQRVFLDIPNHIPDAPWCWNIYLHLGDFWANVGKYSIDGAYGIPWLLLKSSAMDDFATGRFFLGQPMQDLDDTVMNHGFPSHLRLNLPQ